MWGRAAQLASAALAIAARRSLCLSQAASAGCEKRVAQIASRYSAASAAQRSVISSGTATSAGAGTSGAAASPAPWRAVSAAASAAARQQLSSSGGTFAVAAAKQQSCGYARYLQFQPRSVGGGGGLPRLSWDSDKVLWGLISANIGGWVLWRVAPDLMHTHATVSIEGLRAGRVWTTVTAAFSHRDLYHLGANMIGLYFFGRDVGRLFGGKKLLLLYLAGGMVGSLAHCGWYLSKACHSGEGRYGRARWFGFAPSALGASAAVNALTVADILLYPTRTILLYALIPMPAALLGVLWLLNDVSGAMDGHRGHIAHAGHLGGTATGLVWFILFKRGIIRPRGSY